MLTFPETTYVHRRLPKEAFTRHMQMNSVLRTALTEDIEAIYMEWDLSPVSLHLTQASELKEILVLRIEQKVADINPHLLEAIAQQNHHRLVYVLDYADEQRLGLYLSRTKKLYLTDWQPAADVTLALDGYTVAAIWDNIVRQIALHITPRPGEPVEAALTRQAELEKVTKLIATTEKKARQEIQPRKKFALYQELKTYKAQREELTNG